ncbi:MAG TPA: SBBP repeat-containing protein [Myxococcales bacterium]
MTQSKAVLLVARFERGPLETWNTEPRTSGTVLGMSFIGARRNPQVLGEEELPGKVNYLVGSNARTWRTNIATYARVTYRDLYPGIDLTYYGREGQLEYDFVVRPGADLRRILVGFSGAEKLEVDAQGDLLLRTGPDVIRQRKPIAYQEVNGMRREIPVSYVLKGAHRVAFKVAAHDSSRPLIIDPALFYSTYLGGSIRDGGQGIAVDSAGNAYVTGLSNSPDFPTAGAFQGTLAGGFDAFVTKINAVGSALVYSTYLGGSGDDYGLGIAVDAAGNASLTGSTNSLNFPTTLAAFQRAPGGSADAFVTKLNSSGSALIYSTYLGGSGDDVGQGIKLDSLGNAYVTGSTSSADFPTMAAFQGTLAGSFDAFVTKLNLAGSAPLLYSTYLGGSSDDRGFGVAVDSTGNAYVTGYTTSTDFPTTSGALQTANAGGSDGFMIKLNPAGSLSYSTYLGGSGQDIGQAIAVNAAGSAFVTGRTSGNFPTTAGAFQSAFGGGVNDAFVTRLNPSGSTPLVYSTYLGGSGDDVGYGIALDGSDDAYVTGYTNSLNFPTTAGVFQTTFGGGLFDAFVTKLNPAGSAPLLYSTYLGGGGADAAQGIAVDALLNAYVTGFTGSTNFPTTPGAFQTTLRGSVFNAFVTKIAEVQLEQCPADGQGECEQTGGQGTVDDHDDGNQGQGTFSFIVRRPSTTQRISGGLQFVNPATGTDVRSVTLSSLLISGNSAIIAGTCTNSGAPCTFLADVTDSGPTGSGDTFTISISGGPARGGPLRSGKIQVRAR